MPQLHLPRVSYDLFVYDFRYDFSGTAEYNSMQTYKTFTLARERINKMYGLWLEAICIFIRGCDYRKIVSMIREYCRQTRCTARKHETPARQTKQSNQFSLSHQDDCKLEWTKLCTTRHRIITDSHKGSNNKQCLNNNRAAALERTAV